MTAKLNSYTLPNETIDSMKSILSQSIQKSVELGFALCSDQQDNLKARNICTGETCTIGIKGECEKEEKFLGAYHTHPNSYSSASAADLIYCGAVPNTCIGGGRDGKINCYTWKHNNITKEKYNDLVDRLKSGTIQTADPVHKKTIECMKEFGSIVGVEKKTREEDKKVDMLFSLIRMAEQENTSKHIIDSMKEAMKPLLDERSKFVNEMNKISAELVPKYYKEKILE